MSHFGQLSDVVLPKIAQKRQSNSQDLTIFVKSSSGSAEIHNFRFFGGFEQFLAKPHLVALQNVTFWTFGKNMSGY